MNKILILLLFTCSLLHGQGIILKTTSESIGIITTSTSTVNYQANWSDIVVATGATPGSSEGLISSATTTTAVASPASNTYRIIKSITIKNYDAAVTNTITIQKTISATNYQLTAATVLLAGESLYYESVISLLL